MVPGGEWRLRVIVLLMLCGLSACSWFAPKKAPIPDPTQIIVTGAPVNSTIYIDGAPVGQATTQSDHPQILDVAAGDHKVEVHVGDSVIYREDIYVAPSEHRFVRVLSGLN
jgi:hypothetical protein